mgnify:CR=1 FL=1
MSFRTVVIANQAKISYKNRFLVVKKDIEEKYIHLSEIDTIIVDSISVSISSYLLKELTDNKINIIFCDEKHNPYGQLQPFYSRHNSSKKIIEQTKWTLKNKDNLWTLIVKNKIINQAFLLKKIKSKQANLVFSYVDEVGVGDKSNREGHASKVYFNALFGKKFSRGNNDIINAKLNYGYAILLSTISKEITNNGYLTQLGIHHKNEFNPFNLACDLMEPFRVIIDAFVYYNQEKELDSNLKLDIINIFNNIYTFNSKKYTLKDIIELYVKNTFKVLSEDKEYKDFIYEG